MNPVMPSPRPRVFCRLVRFWRAHRGSDAGSIRGAGARHVAQCPDCQCYYAAERKLDEALQAEAATMTSADIPLGLEDRIWAAVKPEVESRPGASDQPNWRGCLLAGSTALAAAAVAMVIWLGPADDSSGFTSELPGADIAEFDAGDLQALVTDLEAYSQRLLTVEVRPTTETPGALEQELTALADDTRAAWRFLERSFLPTPRSAGADTPDSASST